MIRTKDSKIKKSRGPFSKKSGPLSFKGEPMSKRKAKAQQEYTVKNHFELRKIEPLTVNQKTTFDQYNKGFNLVLHGYAGTGKTFCALYLALREVLSGSTPYERIMIIRSAVPSRDIGFLPGNIKEKVRTYEDPYREICDDLFGRGDGYDVLKLKNIIDFTTTSYLRGRTLNNTIVILDEVQNLEFHEMNTVMTRLGNVSKIMVCGDFRQTDLIKQGKDNIVKLLTITRNMPSFSHVEFGIDDIVRSGIVKEFILAKEALGI